MFSLENIKLNNLPFPYFVKNNILPENLALKAQEEILNIKNEKWDRYDNPFENKYTLRDKNKLPPTVKSIFEYLISDKFLEELSFIYDIKLYNDPTKIWWGVHKYDDGDKLDIHVDAGLHPVSKQKKQVTLGIYLSKDWKEENGGHLEIWEGKNSVNNDAKLIECKEKVLPAFNTLLSFECNDYAWHGNPHPVNCKNGEKRIFLTISYVSEKYDDLNKRQKAFFIKHPNEPENEEKNKLRLLRADPVKYKEVYRI
jgi:Rps23 Pro-64 3,4-dihydroxylase Tpa1-like proline 4-hydroxylase